MFSKLWTVDLSPVDLFLTLQLVIGHPEVFWKDIHHQKMLFQENEEEVERIITMFGAARHYTC